jgi:chemotaxis protein CheX
MTPEETQIRAVIRSVWSTQLDLEILDDRTPPENPDAPTLTAAIHIGGDFRGGIRLECSRSIVRRAASIMFGLPEERLSKDDERDVVGELTNVVAGNLKALIPGANSISLPIIIDGTDYEVSTPEVRASDDYRFVLDGERMTVTVLEYGS